MTAPQTLTELIESNRSAPRSVTYLEGENEERSVSYGELHQRALGILYHLQKLGARRGDKLILFLGNNEQFIDAFWAAVLGGIIPVPVALGISDEHRHKLLRIARKLGKPFIYTDRRSLERIGAFAGTVGAAEVFEGLRSRAFLVDTLDDRCIGRSLGIPHSSSSRPAPPASQRVWCSRTRTSWRIRAGPRRRRSSRRRM
jgi:acyl-CoA synthetase (AMP-forming)/AMP-acid ligase II